MVIKRKADTLLIAILTSFGIFAVYLYFYIEQTQAEIQEKIIHEKIAHVSDVLENIAIDITQQAKDEQLAKFFQNRKVRDNFESKLSQIITKNTKYTYLLFLDKNGKFRFLLDGSKEDKARYYQKFDPISPQAYKEIYKTHQGKIIWQKNMENLWMTYLHPVIYKDKVIALLSVDMTTDLQKTILNLMQPLKNFFIVLIIFIFLLISVGTIQLYNYFKTKKRLFEDQLTSLFNRHYLTEVVPALDLHKYAIAMLDLDRFKHINDTYGHKAGDLILIESAKILKQNLKEDDILVRYGGEEFLLLIYNDELNNNFLDICNDMRRKIAKYTFRYEGNEIHMSISIGLHPSPGKEKDFTEAIKVADKMLYIAKQRGRNQVIVYDKDHESCLSDTITSIDEVKLALEQERVICHYQPIVDPHTNTIIKYEALVRIATQDGTTIYPGSFLPHLKHTNIHYKLTIRILTICFETFANNDLEVSINLSFSDFINDDINNFIIEQLQKNQELASRITFEVLESDEIEDITLFKEKIKQIQSLGAIIAIDDFGSGYSNFKAVLDIEANFLKIDGTLIQDITKNEKNYKVVKNIIQFAKDTNMKTIAEFVSSKEIYDKLMSLDIDYMQGFYLAKPSKDIVTKLS